MKPKLSIIIPAYNEEKRIGTTLDEISDYFKKSNLSYEILVIMDGCTDKTPQIVEERSRKNHNIRYRIYKEKQGKGGALIRGFKLVKGEYVAYVDADGATPPQELMKLYDMIGGYDGVIGSRWLETSRVTNKQTLARRIASRGFNMLTRVVLGLDYKDTQCPAKVFRRKVIADISDEFHVNNFAMDACLLYLIKKKGYNVIEVPIKWNDKPLSSLKISKAVWAMFWTVLKTRIGV